MKRAPIAILALAVLTLGSCRKAAAPEQKPAEQTQADTTPKYRHKFFREGSASPAIVSISPTTVPIRAGHAYTERYTLEYDILGIEKVKSGYITIYSPGVGQVQKIDFSPQAHGSIEFTLDVENFDFGPSIRFRAVCPKGNSDWIPMGLIPADYPPHDPSLLQMGTISPSYIQARNDANNPASGVEITLWGQQFETGCKPETEVDGTSVQLQNVSAYGKQIKGLLLRSDIQQRAVAARYFDVTLVLEMTTPQMRVGDSTRLIFRDL